MADSKVTRDAIAMALVKSHADYAEYCRQVQTRSVPESCYADVWALIDAYALQCRREERERCAKACDELSHGCISYGSQHNTKSAWQYEEDIARTLRNLPD